MEIVCGYDLVRDWAYWHGQLTWSIDSLRGRWTAKGANSVFPKGTALYSKLKQIGTFQDKNKNVQWEREIANQRSYFNISSVIILMKQFWNTGLTLWYQMVLYCYWWFLKIRAAIFLALLLNSGSASPWWIEAQSTSGRFVFHWWYLRLPRCFWMAWGISVIQTWSAILWVFVIYRYGKHRSPCYCVISSL